MAKILKFPKDKAYYSDKFLSEVKPNHIGDFIKEQNPTFLQNFHDFGDFW